MSIPDITTLGQNQLWRYR